MQTTDVFGLSCPDYSDYADISVLSSNFKLLDANAVKGLTMTAEDYDALEAKDGGTLYIVLDTEKSKFSLYLGEYPLNKQGGGGLVGDDTLFSGCYADACLVGDAIMAAACESSMTEEA